MKNTTTSDPPVTTARASHQRGPSNASVPKDRGMTTSTAKATAIISNVSPFSRARHEGTSTEIGSTQVLNPRIPQRAALVLLNEPTPGLTTYSLRAFMFQGGGTPIASGTVSRKCW